MWISPGRPHREGLEVESRVLRAPLAASLSPRPRRWETARAAASGELGVDRTGYSSEKQASQIPCLRTRRLLPQPLEGQVAEGVRAHELADLAEDCGCGRSAPRASACRCRSGTARSRAARDAQVHLAARRVAHICTILRSVVPRTIESSTSTTRLPSKKPFTALCFTFTPKSADRLRGLDEGALDVVVADQRLSRTECRTPRRSRAPPLPRVEHRHDHVGRHRVLARQHAAELLAERVDVVAAAGSSRAARSRCARRCRSARALAPEGPQAAQPAAADHHHLAGLEIALVGRADQVERAGLAGHDPGARADRARAGGSRGDRAPRSARRPSAHQAERALHARERVDQALLEAFPRASARAGARSPRCRRSC